jgi:hypothetical protein
VVVGEKLEFISPGQPGYCEAVLSARTSSPLNKLSNMPESWRQFEQLRSQGILLQGQVCPWEFDVYCLEKLTGLAYNRWRPHYMGRFESRSTGTAVVGEIRVATTTKMWTLAMCLGSIFFIILGIVVRAVPLAIFGSCFFVFWGIIVPSFCLFMARDEWEELSDILRRIFSAI